MGDRGIDRWTAPSQPVCRSFVVAPPPGYDLSDDNVSLSWILFTLPMLLRGRLSRRSQTDGT